MNKISLILLETLYEYARSPSMLECSKRLKISQPAVSMRLRDLEAQLPKPLFTASGRKKILSPFGQELLNSTSIYLEGLSSSLAKFEDSNRDHKSPDLLIGAARELWSRISQKLNYPGKIVFTDTRSRQALSLLKDRSLHLTILKNPPSVHYLSKRVFIENGSKLVVHRKWLRNFENAERAASQAEFLTSTPALAYDRDYTLLEEWLKRQKVAVNSIRIKAIAQDWNVLARMVEAGHGYTVIPEDIPIDTTSVDTFLLPRNLIRNRKYYFVFRKDLFKTHGQQIF